MDSTALISAVETSISNAEAGRSKLPQEVLDIRGMSGRKIRHFLNNVCGIFAETRYLEIGVWRGSTLISAYHGNGNIRRCIAVDDWSEFGGPKIDFHLNVGRYPRPDGFAVFESDAFSLDLSKIGDKFNVYFYDGGHLEVDQYRAYTYFNPVLDDTFITMVDDWNCVPTQEGTRRAFRDLRYTVVKEWQLLTRSEGDAEGWWNGFYIAIVKKPGVS